MESRRNATPKEKSKTESSSSSILPVANQLGFIEIAKLKRKSASTQIVANVSKFSFIFGFLIISFFFSEKLCLLIKNTVEGFYARSFSEGQMAETRIVEMLLANYGRYLNFKRFCNFLKIYFSYFLQMTKNC